MTTREYSGAPAPRLAGAAAKPDPAPVAGDAAAAGARRPPASVRPDRVYLGWQYAVQHPDPGPVPGRPVPPAGVQLDEGWVAAQRREDGRLIRPAKIACAGAAVLACGVLGLRAAGLVNPWLAGLVLAGCLTAAVVSGRAVRNGAREMQARIAAEQRRLAKIRTVQQSRLAARQESHARQFRAWQSRRVAFERQPQWYAVSLPADIDRVDVAGGTLTGWSAMLSMIAVPRLGAGGEVTVLDLTEGAVATDLLAVARRSGIQPLVWVLPGDLPRLDLGTGLGREAVTDLLSATAAASGDPSAAGDPAKDSAILDRVIEVLGGEPRIAQVTAALRALAQIGDPRGDLRSGLLTSSQLEQITALFGRSAAERVVIDRAWELEARLRKLDQLGSAAVKLPPSRLRVAWLDRRSGAVANRVLGTYLTVALAHMLRQAPAAGTTDRWQRTLCVLGAERLSGDVLDRLCDACEVSGTGLVVAHRSLPAHVRDRLGRGNAAVAFMRLGNAQDAKVASEQIGTEHRFVLSQLTDTVGTSVTDTGGDSYTSTIGTADSLADSASVNESSGRSQSRGRSRAGGSAPFGNFTASGSRDSSHSTGTSDSRSITLGINSSTSWGLSTSSAVGANASLARASQRSREFLVEQHELQQLPASAMIVSYASPAGRRVVLADANPGIFGLRSSTLLSLDEAVRAASRVRAGAGGAAGGAGGAGGTAGGTAGGSLPADRTEPGSGQPGSGQPASGQPGSGHPGLDTAKRGRPGAARSAAARPGAARPGDGAGTSGPPGPNLGPPPERLDWRTPRC
jgi:hypothetical protein